MGIYEKRQRVWPDEPKVEIENDTVYFVKTIEQYDDGVKIINQIPVMTKDIFIKCYEEWILNNHLEDDHK